MSIPVLHVDRTLRMLLVVALADGGAVIAGRPLGSGAIRPLVVERIDASGASVWREEFSDLSGDRQFATTVLADEDRIFVCQRRADVGANVTR